MVHVLVIGGAVLIATMVLYGAVLASVAILRDRELSRATQILRLLFVWLVPFLGAIVALRVSAEESPALIPSRAWLWPFLPLLSDKHLHSPASGAIDIVGDSERALPRQTAHVIANNVADSAPHSWVDSSQ